jgi:hypothetical protein
MEPFAIELGMLVRELSERVAGLRGLKPGR